MGTIAEEITALNTNLTAAKNAVTAKGGTVGDTGLAGLATEIASIPSGGGPSEPSEWGILRCRSWSESWEAGWDGDIYDVTFDQATFLSFIAEHPLEEGAESVSIDISQDMGVEPPVTLVQIYGFAEDPFYGEPATIQDLEQMGVTIVDYDPLGAGQIFIDLIRNLSNDIALTLELNEAQYNALGYWDENNTEVLELVGLSIPRPAIKQFEFGTEPTSVPDNFLRNCTELTLLDTTNWSVTSIGDNFCLDCLYVDCAGPMDLSSVTSIGDSFMYYCAQFNKPITFSSNLTTIGDWFLCGCNAFNQPLSFPDSLTHVGHGMLFQSSNMCSTIDINNLSATVFDYGEDGYTLVVSPTSSAYTDGVPIDGTYASDFLAKFPNYIQQSQNCGRNLRLAS